MSDPSLPLPALQAWFANAVMQPSERGAEAERHIARLGLLAPGGRLDLYRHAYEARLVECLVDDYPALAYLLGEDAFAALSRAYMAAHPSRLPNLNSFGRTLPSFVAGGALAHLAGHPDHAELSVFAADLARLEWALVSAVHAPGDPPLTSDALAEVPEGAWGAVRLAASRTTQLHRFSYPVNAYYQSFCQDQAPAVPPSGATAIAIARRQFVVWRFDLTPPMATLLEGLLAGTTLEEALGRVAAELDDPARVTEVAGDVMRWFRAWVEDGFFRGIAW